MIWLKAAGAFLKAIPLWLYVAVALLFCGWLYGHSQYKAGQRVQAQLDSTIIEDFRAKFAKLDEQAKATEIAVKNRNKEVRDLLDSSNKAREEGISRANQEQQAIVAGIRADTFKLRKQWASCPASHPMPNNAGPGSQPYDSADDQAESAGRIVRAAADADLTILALQDYARACSALTQPLP